jgi:hypothetical protein
MAARDRGPEDTAQQALREQLTAFATALKQSTIYPAGHPRVRQGIGDFLAPFAQRERPYTLLLRGSIFHAEGCAIRADHASTRWLAERVRELGLRGLELTPACTVDDVLELAAVFRDARRNRAATWPADHPRLRALPLTFTGRHHESAGAAPDESIAPFASLPPHVGAVLVGLRDTEQFQQRLRQIERIASTEESNAQRDVDVLAAIGALIPEHVASDPCRVTTMVQRILDDFATELEQLAARDKPGNTPRLGRRIVEFARRYFPSDVAEDKPALPPAGRPEDAKIQADIGALVRELAGLPRDLPGTKCDVAAAAGRALGHEVLGIQLHAFANAAEPKTATTLTSLLRKHAAERPELLDPYLQPGATDTVLPGKRRAQLLGLLVEAGHVALAHARGYVDETLVTRGFPEGLPLAARVLGADANGAAVLRRGLATVALALTTGGVDAALACGALRDPVVLRALLGAGGDEARRLLLAAAKAEPRVARTAILAHLRTRALPELAALVLRTHRNDEALTAKYVGSLWLTCDSGRPDPATDAASAELLVRAVAANDAIPHADRIAALSYLHLAPRGAVEVLLRRLAREGRFTRWGREARELRLHARRALALLHTTRGR